MEFVPNSRARPPSSGDCEQLLAQTSLEQKAAKGANHKLPPLCFHLFVATPQPQVASHPSATKTLRHLGMAYTSRRYPT